MSSPANTSPTLLTPRQLEVLELLAKGLTNREIAGVLGIAPATAKVHVSAVIEALEVTNRTEAAMALRELGLGAGEPEAAEAQGDAAEAGAEAGEPAAVPGFGGRPAIAVLPFQAMGAEADDALVDGLVEDFITRLASWRWFPVIARNSTFAYKGQAVDVPRAARELGARYVVEGSVRRSGHRLRVTVQLLEGRRGHHVFAERFDLGMQDVFEAQDAMVDSILGALEPALLRVEGVRALARPATRLSAWEAFQRGVTLLRRQHPEEVREAEHFLARAAAEEPGFAAAHGEHAFAHLGIAAYTLGATQLAPTDAEGMQSALAEAGRHVVEATASARRALACDPHEPTARIAVGVVASLEGRLEDAEAALVAALDRNPSSSMGAWLLGSLFIGTERAEQAIPLLQRAVRLAPRDPLAHHYRGALAAASLLVGRAGEALEEARRSVEITPDPGLSYAPLVVSALVRQGQMQGARAEAARLRALRPDFNLALARLLAPAPVVELIRETLAEAGWDVPG